MKSFVLILICVAFILSTLYSCKMERVDYSKASETTVVQADPDDIDSDSSIDYVNGEIKKLKQQEKYQQADIDEKKRMAFELLDGLRLHNYIRNLYYDDTNRYYSFQYADSTLGGMHLEEFAAKDDLMPMN